VVKFLFTMSLKVHLDRDRGSRTVSDKGKHSSRYPNDLRSMLNKERRDRDERDEPRERREHRDRERGRDRDREKDREKRQSSNGGDLRDRLDRFKDSDYRDHRDQHCDISQSNKSKLLILEDKNPEKDFKGKENGDLENLLEFNRKEQKDLEKKLSSEWSERKKKKKKRSKSRSKDKDRKPLVSKESDNRKRKLSPDKTEKDVSEGSKPKKDKNRSKSRNEKDEKEPKKKKKEKKNRNRSGSKEKRRSQSKTSSGSRKSRIDSGISVSTNFSKESLSISPRDDRIPIQMEAESTENVEIEKIDKSSPKKELSSEKSPKVKKEENLNDSKKTNSPSPSPPRRVLEVSQADTTIKDENEKEPNIPTEKDSKEDVHKTDNKSPSKSSRRSRSRGRRSRSRERRRSRSRERRTRSRDRHHHRPRDLKDEIDAERRRRRDYYYERDRDRYSRRSYHRHHHEGHHGHHRRSGSPPAASWEDKVNSFLANTASTPAVPPPSSSLVEITKSEILPTDFDPSKPPPGLSVVPPDYAITEFAEEETVEPVTPIVSGQPVRMLTDVQTGQLIHQPRAGSSSAAGPTTPSTPSEAVYSGPPPMTSLPPPDYQQTVDITITAQPQAPVLTASVSLEQEIAALNALNQEREKKQKDDKPLTLKEKKKLEKGRKEVWQFVSKKLLSDPVFCDKVKKKKGKGVEDLKEKAEKCAVRIGLKLEKSGFSETRLWLMLKDNEKGIVGFHDELSAAVSNGTIETDLDARKPKDRLDAELLKDGTIFKYIGQYIQGNPTMGKMASSSETMPSTNDLQSILEHVTNSNSNSAATSPVPPEEPESEWSLAIKSFAPFKTYLNSQKVPSEVMEAYGLCLVLSGFNYTSLHSCVTNFQPPEPENPDEPPETIYGHLLNCLREISFEKYPRIITDNIDGHTVSIVRFVLDHFSKPRSPTPTPSVEQKRTSPVPPVQEDVVPTGGNTSSQLPRKKYVLVSVSVDTIPVESGLAVWQVCLHTPGLPEEEDPDFEMLMVPSGVNELKLNEAGFMFNNEKNIWYHQGTEFGRRKAENEEKSVEKLVSYLEELRSGGRGAGLNNGLVLLFECSEDFGLVRSLLSSHSADIWSDTVRGVGCIDHFTRQAEIPTNFIPPYYKVCVGGDSKWLTTMTTTDQTGEQRQVKVEAWTRAEIVYNILCDVSGAAPTYDKFIKWYCYPSTSITMTTLAGNLELQRQMLPLQNHVDRQLFNSRVQCVLEGVFAPRSELEGLKPFSCVARQAVRRLVGLGFNLDNLKNSFRADPNYEIPANVFLQDMTQVQRLRVHAQTDFVRKFIKEYFSPNYYKF